MAYSLDIFLEHDLLWVRYFGSVTDADYRAVVREYPAHPDHELGQRIVIDLRDMTSLKLRHLALILLQAKIADYAMKSPREIVEVIIAPSRPAKRATQAVLRSWRGLETPVVRRMVESADEAAQILGISPAEFHALGEIARRGRLDERRP